MFCAVFARSRFVRFAADEKASTPLVLLAECFQTFGAVLKIVLADPLAT